MEVRLIAKSAGLAEYRDKTLDEIIVGIARLSSNRTEDILFDSPEKLLRHCIVNGHWSIFSMANMTFEITTSRAVARELLRHWSIRVQERSQRYIEPNDFENVELRYKSENNRQSSSEICEDVVHNTLVQNVLKLVSTIYQTLINFKISRETARFLLPECTQTTIIMNGGIREWITLLNQRLHKTAQKECRLVAEEIRDIFIAECPIISRCLYDFENADEVHILDRLVLEKYGYYEK